MTADREALKRLAERWVAAPGSPDVGLSEDRLAKVVLSLLAELEQLEASLTVPESYYGVVSNAVAEELERTKDERDQLLKRLGTERREGYAEALKDVQRIISE